MQHPSRRVDDAEKDASEAPDLFERIVLQIEPIQGSHDFLGGKRVGHKGPQSVLDHCSMYCCFRSLARNVRNGEGDAIVVVMAKAIDVVGQKLRDAKEVATRTAWLKLSILGADC